MITRPDEYKHQNDSYAIVDNANVRGGIFDVADLSTANLNTIPVDKRKVRSTMVNGTDSKIYIYTGATLDNTAWGTTGNWVVGSGSSYTHPTGFTNQPGSALTGANVISQITVNDNGHVTGTTSRALNYSDIGAASSSHTHSNATTATAGFMSTTDKTKLDSITSGAEANQAAFSKVTVGGTTINALTETDTLTLVAGSNITLTPDNLTKSVVVASSGGSSSSYAFGTVAVSGQTSMVADTTNDTLNMYGGTGILLSTNAVTDTLTITYNANYYYTPISTSYTVPVGSTISEIQAGILAALPSDKNLKGGIFRIIFPAGPGNITTITAGIEINGYFNGKIVLMSTTDSYAYIKNVTTGTIVVAINCVDLDLELSHLHIVDILNTANVITYHENYRFGGNKRCSISIFWCHIEYATNALISLPTPIATVILAHNEIIFTNTSYNGNLYLAEIKQPNYYYYNGDFTEYFITRNTVTIPENAANYYLFKTNTGSTTLATSDYRARVTLFNNTGIGDTWITENSVYILK